MSKSCKCSCGNNAISLIYSCSGAANTGFLADSVSRKLMKDGKGKMTCLAAVGANLSGFIESAKCAGNNIVIDGCNVACGSKIFNNHNLNYKHYILTDFGVEKGKTEITEEITQRVSNEIALTY